VFDIDVLDSESPDAFTFEEIRSLRDQIAQLIAQRGQELREENQLSDAQCTELQRAVDDCDRWLSNHIELDPATPHP
jgi:hypothetical protein